MKMYLQASKIKYIKECLDSGDYEQALDMADRIKLNKIKTTADAVILAEAYYQNRLYDEAFEVWRNLYEKRKTRKVLYQLAYLAAKKNSMEEAEHYYVKYVEAAGEGMNQCVLRYQIDKADKADSLVLINTLEKLKEYGYNEDWAYELAKLYHKAGKVEACIQECREIMTWFPETLTAKKAELLQEHYRGADIMLEEQNNQEKDPEGTIDAEGTAEEKVIAEEGYAEEGKAEIESELAALLQDTFEEDKRKQEEYTEQMTAEPSEEFNPMEEKVIEKINESWEEYFGPYLVQEELKAELKDLMNQLSLTPKCLCFLIAGGKHAGKTVLAKRLARTLAKFGYLKYSRVAAIKANHLNQMDIKKKKEQLNGCFILIEEAFDLDAMSWSGILQLMETCKDPPAVCLEDTSERMQQLLRERPEIAQRFYRPVFIPMFYLEDYKAYARAFLAEEGYILEEESERRLDYEIGTMGQKALQSGGISGLQDYLREVRDHAEQRGIRELEETNVRWDWKGMKLLELLPEDF